MSFLLPQKIGNPRHEIVKGYIHQIGLFGVQGKWIFMAVWEGVVQQFYGLPRFAFAQSLFYSMVRNHGVVGKSHALYSLAHPGEKRFPLFFKSLGKYHLQKRVKGLVALPERCAALVPLDHVRVVHGVLVPEHMHVIVLQLLECGLVEDASRDALHGSKDAPPAEHEKLGIREKVLLIGHYGYLRQEGSN